ncbi:MAG: hypothetical protein ACE5JQ_16250 [Candidatus Methylomirabilales bacterium]
MSKYLPVGSAIKAGLIATLTMTLFMYGGPFVGLPPPLHTPPASSFRYLR